MERYAELLVEKREAAKMTKKAVAEYLGVPYTTYASYEYGRCYPGTDVLVKLSELYGITIDDLLGVEKGTADDLAVPPEVVYQFLVDAGFVEPGEDLSETDLSFLQAVLAAVQQWFNAKKA